MRDRWIGFLNATWPYGLTLLLWLIFWWPVVWGEAQFYNRDMTFYALPMKQYMVACLMAGEFPWWTPHLSTGMPFFAELSNQVLYPANVLFFLIQNTAVALSWFSLLHDLGAFWAAIFLARTLGFSKGRAFFVGLVYGFSGYVLSVGDNVNYQPVIVWGPLALSAVCRGLRSARLALALPWLSMLSLCLLMLLLAGDTFNLLFLSVFLPVLWGLRCWRSGLWPGLSHKAAFGFLLISAILSGLMAAVQVVPSAELLQWSVRREPLSYEEITLWSFPLERLVELVAPFFYGSKFPVPHFLGMFMYPQFREPWVDSVYVGVVPAALAGLALWRFRRVSVWIWGVLIGLSFALAFGGNAFYYPWLVQWLPGLGVQRYLEKFVYWSALGFAVLAGFGIRALPGAYRSIGRRLSNRGALLKAGVAVAWVSLSTVLVIQLPSQWWIWPHYYERSISWGSHFYERAPHVLGQMLHWALFALLLSGLVWVSAKRFKRWVWVLLVAACLDLWLVNYQHIGVMPRALCADRPVPIALEKLRTAGAPDRFRVYYDDLAEVEETPAEPRLFARIQAAYRLPYLTDNYGYYWVYRMLYNQERLLFNYGIGYGVSYQNGRFAPLQLQLHKRLDVVLQQYQPDLLTALHGVDYVITPMSPANPRWQKPGYTEVVRDPGLNLKILSVDRRFPRAYLSPNVVWNPEPLDVFKVARPELADALLASRGASHVVLSRLPFERTPAFVDTAMRVRPREDVEVKVESDRPERIALRVTSPYASETTLVLTESWFPGWQVQVDDRPAEAMLANHRFLAVTIPPGTHRVVWTYRSNHAQLALSLSALGGLLWVALLVWGCRMRRKIKKGSP